VPEIHFDRMKLSKPMDSHDPVKCLKHWDKELENSHEGTATLQHELIEALLSLRSQGVRDGWANWSEGSMEMLDLLRRYLPAGSEKARILSDLDKIQSYGEGDDAIGYAEIDRLASDMFHWCSERPVWIQLPEGYQFWLDVPPEAVPPQSGQNESMFSKLLGLLRPANKSPS
jgi:hypothetical protein